MPCGHFRSSRHIRSTRPRYTTCFPAADLDAPVQQCHHQRRRRDDRCGGGAYPCERRRAGMGSPAGDVAVGRRTISCGVSASMIHAPHLPFRTRRCSGQSGRCCPGRRRHRPACVHGFSPDPLGLQLLLGFLERTRRSRSDARAADYERRDQRTGRDRKLVAALYTTMDAPRCSNGRTRALRGRVPRSRSWRDTPAARLGSCSTL